MSALEKSSDFSVADETNATLLSEKLTGSESNNESKKTKREYRYREVQCGIWTLYYPITESWREYLPALESVWSFYDMLKAMPIVWKFVRETLSLGPVFFTVYFVSMALLSFAPAVQLYNNSNILALLERAATGKRVDREQFDHIIKSYVSAFIGAFILRKLESYSGPILQQRVSLHFKQRLLAVQSRFDLTTAENPDVQSKVSRAGNWFASAWSILEGLAEFIVVFGEISGQASVMMRVVSSQQQGSKMFIFLCLARPLASIVFSKHRSSENYYAMVTNTRWLRMEALFSLGTSASYKKEVIADNLEGYINKQYDDDKAALGDIPEQNPTNQLSKRALITYSDFDSIFDSLPLLIFAWNSLQSSAPIELSSLVLMQQAANSLQNTVFGIIYGGNNMATLFKNATSLYEVLKLKPAMVDGDIVYPEGDYKTQKGMSIEFRSVGFQYPMTDKVVLKDMTFSIGSGQLCVIVGENGCGKSTTINLITRMFDCTSGEVIVDGRPLRDFVLSSFRTTTSVMYQDYQHLPLSIRENILLGRPDCEDSDEAVEQAARLGGAYDFVQKLPLKFDTNLEPQNTGYCTNSYEDDDQDEITYQKLIDAQKATKLSGGEWQRLALSKSFMKNSDKVRLLCYDEPSASLDPKAEYEMFERLRQLRGDKTMIFVTHRFGHLTRHADQILYVKDGSIIEQGTHKQLLELDGEYTKMYKIQSQAFED